MESRREEEPLHKLLKLFEAAVLGSESLQSGGGR